MANRTVSARAWELLQQMEAAYVGGSYAQAGTLAEMARTYLSFPTGTDDDLLTVWFSHAAGATALTLDFEAETVTGATAPDEDEVTWDFGDGAVYDITNKELTSNVATLTYAGDHLFAIGDKVLVDISDAVFDGIHTIVDVTDTTIDVAITDSNVALAAATGTGKPAGRTPSHIFPANGKYFVAVTVDTAALTAVAYGRYVALPYSIS